MSAGEECGAEHLRYSTNLNADVFFPRKEHVVNDMIVADGWFILTGIAGGVRIFKG